jgi:lipoyl synthase
MSLLEDQSETAASSAEDGEVTHDGVERRHPEWIKAKMTWTPRFSETNAVLRTHGLVTVCEEAKCPNIGDCYSHQTATFMVLGDTCTRRCSFCAVTQANPKAKPPDVTEPARLAQAALELGLNHIVITSVARDDLPDQGAGHFAACVHEIKRVHPVAQVEVLIPDFRGHEAPLRAVMESPIAVLNHNTETVPRLYRQVRRGARYWRTLFLLRRAGQMRPDVPVKSGLMLGLGEEPGEVLDVLYDLREAGVNILTLGQYLQPGPGQLPVVRYLTPQEFALWRIDALALGFDHVESGPLVRSSYHAWEHVAKRR